MVAPPEKALNNHFKVEPIMENQSGLYNPVRWRLAVLSVGCLIIVICFVGYLLLGAKNSGDNTQLPKGGPGQAGKSPEMAVDERIEDSNSDLAAKKIGDAGKKIHTGRSRNDQVLTALRIFERTFLLELARRGVAAVRSLTDFAAKHRDLPMPGRTHLQAAMPSSVGLWAGAFAEELAGHLSLLPAIYNLVDQSPLGSAAGYGVPLPLDRELTASLLGFSR